MELSEEDEEGPVDLSILPMAMKRLRCAEGETLAGGSKGASPSGKFSGSGKADGLFRYSGAWWLATMRNLPNPIHASRMGWWSCVAKTANGIINAISEEEICFDDGMNRLHRAGISEGCRGKRSGKSHL